jgi:uncharacterized GH25 family protein
MRRRALLVSGFLLAFTSVLAGHDLFLTLREYFVPPDTDLRITALNGTFRTSENSIDRNRIADLSLVTPAARRRLDTAVVRAEGTRTAIGVHTEADGTYEAGMSIKPSEIDLTAKEFNAYLTEEGLGSVLARRRRDGELAKPARERYAKHVKLIFQVGQTRSEGWSTVLGYPVEIVPLRNPYQLGPGDSIRFRLLVNGAPSPAGQEVLAGGRTLSGARRTVRRLVTDAAGEIALSRVTAGTWYVKFIHMSKATEPGLDYISQWATLTFAIASPPGKGG